VLEGKGGFEAYVVDERIKGAVQTEREDHYANLQKAGRHERFLAHPPLLDQESGDEHAGDSEARNGAAVAPRVERTTILQRKDERYDAREKKHHPKSAQVADFLEPRQFVLVVLQRDLDQEDCGDDCGSGDGEVDVKAPNEPASKIVVKGLGTTCEYAISRLDNCS